LLRGEKRNLKTENKYSASRKKSPKAFFFGKINHPKSYSRKKYCTVRNILHSFLISKKKLCKISHTVHKYNATLVLLDECTSGFPLPHQKTAISWTEKAYLGFPF